MSLDRISSGQYAAACLWTHTTQGLTDVNQIIAVDLDTGDVDLVIRSQGRIYTETHSTGSGNLAELALKAIADLVGVEAESLRELYEETDATRRFNENVVASDYESGICLQVGSSELDYQVLRKALQNAVGTIIEDISNQARTLRGENPQIKILLHGRLSAWKLAQALFREQFASDNPFYDLTMGDDTYVWANSPGTLKARGRALFERGELCPSDVHLELLSANNNWCLPDSKDAQFSTEWICLAKEGEDRKALDKRGETREIFIVPDSQLKLRIGDVIRTLAPPDDFCSQQGALVTIRVIQKDGLKLMVTDARNVQRHFEASLNGGAQV